MLGLFWISFASREFWFVNTVLLEFRTYHTRHLKSQMDGF